MVVGVNLCAFQPHIRRIWEKTLAATSSRNKRATPRLTLTLASHVLPGCLVLQSRRLRHVPTEYGRDMVWSRNEGKHVPARKENSLCTGRAHARPYVLKQELLTELPNDTCAIPEPLEIPTIPEGEDRNDSSETPPASANVERLDLNRLDQTTDLAGGDQTQIHAGRDRLAGRNALHLSTALSSDIVLFYAFAHYAFCRYHISH